MFSIDGIDLKMKITILLIGRMSNFKYNTNTFFDIENLNYENLIRIIIVNGLLFRLFKPIKCLFI